MVYETSPEELIQQITELRQWKQSAMHVLNQIDLQEVGKVLGLKVGDVIANKILPAIRRAKAKCGPLLPSDLDGLAWYIAKEVWDAWHGPGASLPGGHDATVRDIQKWIDEWFLEERHAPDS